MYKRQVLGYSDAHSSEFAPESAHPVIDLMPDQQGNVPKGGTMSLGAYPCETGEGSRLRKIYGQEEIWERHRHRYEFNNAYREAYREHGIDVYKRQGRRPVDGGTRYPPGYPP